MEDRPRNLKAMLSEAKDTSELMVDLAYAALYFGDPDMAEEVSELEEQMSSLIHDMRAVCVLAARRQQEADEMASVLQVAEPTVRKHLEHIYAKLQVHDRVSAVNRLRGRAAGGIGAT